MTNKILVNTIILYAKMVITMLLSFVSVPIILRALGADDYGLYSLVAGVIAMLMFLNNAMTVSTQRYMSVIRGENNTAKMTTIFTSSIYLHVVLGIVVCILLEIVALFIFDGFLNISSSRIMAAKIIYQCLVVSTFLSFIAVPYDAALNAYENMLAYSIIIILSSLLKLLLALLLLLCISIDKLIVYGVGMALITLIEFFVKRFYVVFKYKEMKRQPVNMLDMSLFKDMFMFAGWNTFGAFAMVCRNQGVAIILNLFYGTLVNAAYGVANQVNGILASFSGNLQKAINPQLMQSEGSNQRLRVLSLAQTSIKLSVLIYSLLAIPLIIEMDTVLLLWLKEVPTYTMKFCQLILLLNLIMQFSMGIMSAIQAVGNIRLYQITMGIILFLNLPLGYLALQYGESPEYMLISMCIVEGIALVVRVLFAKKIVCLPVRTFCKKTFIPLVCILMLTMIIGACVHKYCTEFNSCIRLCLVIGSTTMTMIASVYMFLMNKEERLFIKQKFKITIK